MTAIGRTIVLCMILLVPVTKNVSLHTAGLTISAFLMISIQPFNTQEDTGVPFHQNLKKKKKNPMSRRAYESVDEKSLS